MNISGINFESIVDGEGVRVAIFISGCLHNCKGCHNKEAQDFNHGKEFTKELQDKIINYVNNTPYIAGITLSGGDPMFSAKEVLLFVRRFKSETKDKSVWLYTGYTIEELMHAENFYMYKLLMAIDVLVDGRFIEELRDTTLPFRGSSNQRIIYNVSQYVFFANKCCKSIKR